MHTSQGIELKSGPFFGLKTMFFGAKKGLLRNQVIQIIVEALKRMPKERRTEGLDAARLILGETYFITALEHLLSSVPHRPDHPWHEIVRQQVGEAIYLKITADLEMIKPLQVAEIQTPYSTSKKKMTKGIFLTDSLE